MLRDQRMKRIKEGQKVQVKLPSNEVYGTITKVSSILAGGGDMETFDVTIDPITFGIPLDVPKIPGIVVLDDPTPADEDISQPPPPIRGNLRTM